MLLEIFAVGSLLFWGALVIPFLVLCYFVFNEKGTYSTLVLLATILAIVLFTNVPVLTWFHSLTIWNVIEYVGGYFVIGIIYMIAKWMYNSFEIKMKYKEFRESYFAANRISSVPPSGTPGFASFSRNLMLNTKLNIDDLPPKIMNHRGDLIFWMTYWHLSLVFTLLGNPLRHLGNFVLNLLTSPLNWISAKMFAAYDELK